MTSTRLAQSLRPEYSTLHANQVLARAGAIPLILGVTGHRDLPTDDLPELTRQIREVFDALHRDYPHTPLALLSPLNEGADRLVADIARDEGVRLIVVLPWRDDVYIEGLHRSGERAEFDDLLARADQIIALPLTDGTAEQQLKDCPDYREQRYTQVGKYIARHSQVLIALWDGTDKPGSGTWQVICCQREGSEAPFAPPVGPLDRHENGPVYHITARRDGAASGPGEIERRLLYPVGFPSETASRQYFHRLRSRLDEFNADAAAIETTANGRGLVEESKSYVLKGEKQRDLPVELQRLLHDYAIADVAAQRYQTRTRRVVQAVFGLVAVAIILFEVYSHLLLDSWGLLAGYLVLLLLGGGLVWFSRRRRLQAKHIDYRALAEALRVQFFWILAGRTESVADHYLRTFRSELDWIRQAVRACHLCSGGHAAPSFPAREGLDWVLEHWVRDQARYFAGTPERDETPAKPGKAEQNERRHHWLERAAFVCFAGAIALAAVLLAVHLAAHHASHLLIVLVFLSAAAAALLHEYAEMAAFAAHASRYEWMGSLFQTAEAHLARLLEEGNEPAAGRLIDELGVEALTENGDWVRQHRLRPLKFPAPG